MRKFYWSVFLGLVALQAAAGYRLAPPKPLEMATSYSPVAGGHSVFPTEALNASGVSVYDIPATSVGMIATERGGDLCVGDALQPPADLTIDWATFSTDIFAQQACREGYVFYTGSTNVAERVIISRPGTFSLTWPGTDGSKTVVRYETGLKPTVVPHRLFWTSAPFNAPGVTLSKNYGVKLFGATNLFWNASTTNANGAAVYDYGIHYVSEQNMCLAYAREKADGTWEGPVGTLVVAYYDTGSCDHYLGCTVVQVAGSDPVYLSACVGDELRPQNENYDPTSASYCPVVQSEQNQTDDPRAPYVFFQKRVAGQYHAKENRVFAISETVAGETGAKKAEVFWEAADDFDVFWPFEQTCYHLTWPKNCPTVVLGRDTAGPGVTIPDAYVPTLLDWKEPNGVARIANNKLELNGEGHFTLRLSPSKLDDFWLLPLNVAYSDNGDTFDTAVVTPVPVGAEIRPLDVSRASKAKAVLAAVTKADLPGYLYAPESRGENWNPNLYHESTAEDDGNPFAALVSALYFVNVTTLPCDAEVWWSRTYAKDGMTEPLTLPVLPQRLKAEWPALDSVGEVVFSSQRGSAAGSRTSAGKGLLVADKEATGEVEYLLQPGEARSLTLGFAFNPSPAAGDVFDVKRTSGGLLSFDLGGGTLAFDVITPATASEPAVGRFTFSGGTKTTVDVSCPPDRWTRFLVTAVTNDMRVYADFRPLTNLVADLTDVAAARRGRIRVGVRDGEKAAAVGTALDDLCAWNSSLSEAVIRSGVTNALEDVASRSVMRVDFETGVRDDDNRYYALDAASSRYFSGTGFEELAPGVPMWETGRFEASDGVTPRAYVQNDASKTGYKPNVEHAIVLAEDGGGYALYALRTDMNGDDRPPYALVEYADGGKGAMRAYRVAMTNEWYAWPTLNCTAGDKTPVARPFNALPSGRSSETDYLTETADNDATVTYKDRNGEWWVRRDGVFEQRMRYVGEEGFVVSVGDDRSLAGETVPAADLANCYVWAARPQATLAGDASNASETTAVKAAGEWSKSDLLASQPTPIPITAEWPSSSLVPVMSVAQVLTKAESGLPDVYDMKTCAVAYPAYGYVPDSGKEGETHTKFGTNAAPDRVVKLIDPTRRKTKTLDVKSNFVTDYGFTLGPTGDLVNRKGYYYFQNMPPNVADRLFVDVTSGGEGKVSLCLVGDYVEKAAGTSYLRVNSLTSAERDGINATFAKLIEKYKSDTAIKNRLSALTNAVVQLYDEGDYQPSRQDIQYKGKVLGKEYVMATNKYVSAADHYALVATGEGNGYVTLLENDGPDADSLPVSMHVLYVTTNLYCGKIVAVTDANNTLSEQLNLLYTAPLGKAADNFKFEWFAADAPSDGHVLTVPSIPTVKPTGSPGGDGGWGKNSEQKTGGVCINAVAAADTENVSMTKLVNRYWTMHYQAKESSRAWKTTGGRWSNWCSPMLAEGWLQRVLNAITPFSQRLADLSANKAELKYTMPEQIGAPWEGDVALNNENLNNVGLEQLYRTILNRAESMSIAGGAQTGATNTTDAVNKQLAECVARLADMYMTLGAEAYSDAQNPLIASSDGTEFAGSVFCFANQVPSLLDEELALLRGRTKSVAPALTESPFYNRLMWNFTKGVTQGEVAYVNNYNISAVDGVLDANAAASMYPQGHGDAYGYYLSALKGYYRLLRNPCFSWGKASMMEMLVADHVVNMDYEEEDKFAECAYNLAKIGAEVVSLTARKQWSESGGDILSAYFDSTNTCLAVGKTALPQAFGTGEWACRTGYGALCNWAVANSILPPDDTSAVTHFKDQSISTVTRQTAASLEPLASAVANVERTLNAVDAGVNPLGLSDNAIPFDISPADFRGSVTGQGAKSHYEQIRERADVALKNAKTVLDYANIYGSRLRAIENEEFDANANAAEMEASYERQLIAVYGRPFSGDIGPGKTYAEGYTGPDLYHYMYMDLSEYGLDNLSSTNRSVTLFRVNYVSATNFLDGAKVGYIGYGLNIENDNNNLVKILEKAGTTKLIFNLTADGLIAMPKGLGRRACEGTLQTAYRSFLTAYVQANTALSALEASAKEFEWQRNVIEKTYGADVTYLRSLYGSYTAKSVSAQVQKLSQMFSTGFAYRMDLLSKTFGFSTKNQNDDIVGQAWSLPFKSLDSLFEGMSTAGEYYSNAQLKLAADEIGIGLQWASELAGLNEQLLGLRYSDFSNRKSAIANLKSASSALYSAATSAKSAFIALTEAQETFRTVAEQGLALLEERKRARTRLVNVAVQRRYADMYARVARNTALSKFSTAFDVAQRYVFELAKVYDYETGLDVSDSASGKAFVNATIATRALGTENVSVDGSVTDGGLWDLVNRMDRNFAQLKGRLGINNPDVSTKWFSLRYSCFRISPDATSDEAWKQVLDACWRDDICEDPLFAAHCQPPARAVQNAAGAEPGFIFTFPTSINLAENFFGKPLQGGETSYSSSDYAVKVYAVGVDFDGYADATTTTAGGLACEPNLYLVPVGTDYMRAPLSSARTTVGFKVVDQVLPLPYDVGENDLADTDWVATLNGLDGTADSAVRIRRHSTLRMGPVTSSTRLVGRSVWNDQWILVVPAAEMGADTNNAKAMFMKYVKDIRIGIQAYSRSGN